MTWLGEQLGRIADDMPERDLAARALEIHQRRRRNFMALTAAAVVVVTVLAATVAVRALPAEPRAAAPPPEQSTITVGMMTTLESVPVVVALNKGYFKEEGLTVEWRSIPGVAAAVSLAESGIADLAQTDYATVFTANEAGKKFKIVSSLHQAAPGSFAIAVDTKSKIRTVTDLKRKRVAISGLSGLGQLTLTAVLKRAGLTLGDVRLAVVPDSDMLRVLGKGQVDAALLAEPLINVGREVKRVRIVADPMTQEFANLYTGGMMATDEWVREHPRTVAAFQRALVKAQRLIATDPQQMRDALYRFARVPQKWAAGVAFGSYPAHLDLTELQRVADLARAYKLIKHPVDVRNTVVKGG
ncbi:ABC transporter substrate-binding protein [Nonomuraea sp. NPDC049129]|uniref:ABC transporter substrate-binding protein n=1 Tax=Nonomuraea sp. NPDC049129 TaxID=3155272 RepID=UPI0033CDA0A9